MLSAHGVVGPAGGAGAVTRYVATAGLRHQARAFDPASGGPRQRSRQLHAGRLLRQAADVNLDTITVTPTRTESSVVDAMAGASVITSGEIQQQQPGSIADMLQNVPGVASEVTPNDPGQSINIRGMQDFGRVNILIDGARQDYQISGPQRERHVLSRSAIRRPGGHRARARVEHLRIGRHRRRRLIHHPGVDSVLNADEKYGALQRFIVGYQRFGRRHFDRWRGQGRSQCRYLWAVSLSQQHLLCWMAMEAWFPTAAAR